MNDPILTLLDMNKSFEVQTYATYFALEGVMLQEHLVAFES